MTAFSVRFSSKSLKKERNVCKFCGKFVYFGRQNFVSDAAVSNWAGGFGHPCCLTRGVRLKFLSGKG